MASAENIDTYVKGHNQYYTDCVLNLGPWPGAMAYSSSSIVFAILTKTWTNNFRNISKC